MVEASSAFLNNKGRDDGAPIVPLDNKALSPPLIPIVFRKIDDSGMQSSPLELKQRRQAYANRVLDALERLASDYEGLPLHANTAVLVPDAQWARLLKDELETLDLARTRAASAQGKAKGTKGVKPRVHPDGNPGKYDFVDAIRGARTIDGARSPDAKSQVHTARLAISLKL